MPAHRITVSLDQPIGRIAPEIYGHFAEHLGGCVQEGIWVGEDSKIPNIGGLRNDVIEALRRLHVPVLRWPGGCYADDYHWEDGIGPRAQRPRRINIHWGQTIEDGCFGTHEFMQLCRLIGTQPYFAGNLGSGAVREMRDWVEYCNFAGDSALAMRRATNGSTDPFAVRYWGVGNENWGCGGSFCPEDYAVEYKRYAEYLRDFNGTKLFLIACGPNGNDASWTRRFFTKLGSHRKIHGFAAHYYTWNRQGQYGTATQFNTDQYYGLLADSLKIEPLIIQQRAIMDGFDPRRNVGLVVDEWGAWHAVEPGREPAHLYQQNSLRDALLAGMTLNIFNRHADKLAMCNIAQMVNVLQAMILTDGPRMITTPTFHVFEMFKGHQGGQAIQAHVECGDISFTIHNERRQMPRLSVSASIVGETMTLSVVNADAMLPVEAEIVFRGGSCREADIRILENEDLTAHNTFEHPNLVAPALSEMEIEFPWIQLFPPASVTVIQGMLIH